MKSFFLFVICFLNVNAISAIQLNLPFTEPEMQMTNNTSMPIYKNPDMNKDEIFWKWKQLSQKMIDKIIEDQLTESSFLKITEKKRRKIINQLINQLPVKKSNFYIWKFIDKLKPDENRFCRKLNFINASALQGYLLEYLPQHRKEIIEVFTLKKKERDISILIDLYLVLLKHPQLQSLNELNYVQFEEIYSRPTDFSETHNFYNSYREANKEALIIGNTEASIKRRIRRYNYIKEQGGDIEKLKGRVHPYAVREVIIAYEKSMANHHDDKQEDFVSVHCNIDLFLR
jgi:hypothetical protein